MAPLLTPLYLALVAMMVQQACATLGRATLPVIAPVAMTDLGVSPALLGIFVGMASLAGMATTLGCGSFILRHGALRMTQAGMVIMAVGLTGCASGSLIVLGLSAILIGVGSAISTPASSHLLARYATPAQAPMVFSIKQTGVPVGLMAAGFVAPVLVGTLGWQQALLIVALLCVTIPLLLQPIRTRFDADRQPSQPFALTDVRDTLMMVLREPQLRAMAAAAFSFVGLQSVFSAFLVIFLVEGLGYSLTSGGQIFSFAMGMAIPVRIGWGWVAGGSASPRRMLGGFGIVMAVASAGMALVTPEWPVVAVIALAVVLSVTALSWHGVLLAEVARLAPPGRVGATTGGVLSFGDAAAMLMPLIFSATIAITGGYRSGFVVAAVPPLAAAAFLLSGSRRREGRQDAPGR